MNAIRNIQLSSSNNTRPKLRIYLKQMILRLEVS